MALNTCEMWSNGIKIAFFPKNYKKLTAAGGFTPQAPIASGGWGLRPQTSVLDSFQVRKYTLHISQFRYFQFLPSSLSPLPSAKSRLRPKHRPRLLILHSTISLPPTKSSSFENLWWCHCTWLVVWALPIKNPGYAYACRFVESEGNNPIHALKSCTNEFLVILTN